MAANRLPVALFDAQTALDVRQQGFGAAWDCQGRRDISSGTADSQIPDLSAQRSTLLFQHAVQLSFAAGEFFSPRAFELFDVAGLPGILFALQAGLIFGILARLVGGFLLVQQLLDLGFQARDILRLRQTFDAEYELAVLLGVKSAHGFVDTIQAVQLEFQHLLSPRDVGAGPACEKNAIKTFELRPIECLMRAFF